jgi:hypothetical protein
MKFVCGKCPCVWIEGSEGLDIIITEKISITWFPETCLSREVFSCLAEFPWQVSDPLSISYSAWSTMGFIFIRHYCSSYTV